MKKKTEEIKFNISLYAKYAHKMNLLKDSYQGETCYILGCGPSLNDIPADTLRDLIKNDVVFTIKQAYSLFSDISDFHFFNCCNFTPYTYNDKTIFCSQADALPEHVAKRAIWHNQKYDLNFVLNDNKNHSRKLTRSLNFDQWTFDNTLNRPWGPGIIHETVFYMAMHLGVKTIRTIGWDHIDPSSTNSKVTHFYNKDTKLLSPAAPVDIQEIRECIQLSKEKSRWMKNNGVTLQVYDSDKCYIHEEVERFKF